jgi:hypothetical protein
MFLKGIVMRALIGPYFVFNQLADHPWCYFELNDSKVTCFVWRNSRWSLQAYHPDNAIFYTYSPSEKTLLSFVLTQDQGILKIPVFEQELEGGKPSVRTVSQVFRPFLLEAEMRWVPSHLARASAFGVDVSVFPALIDDIFSIEMFRDMPALPAVEVVSSSNSIQPHTKNEVTVDITRAFLRCKGREFPVSRLLSEEQQSFIVQFIENNGDWPFPGGGRQTQIQLGQALLSGANSELFHALGIKKYRDPMFLAELLTESFYPVNKKDKGFYATVAHVWCFVNVLLAHALRLLGERGKIVLPYAPRGYGVSSAEYLSRHTEPAHKRVRCGFSITEQDVHHIVMNYVDEIYEPNFDEYTTREQDAMIIVLRRIIAREASVLDLSESLFNSIANVFQSGGELASDYLTTSCKTILNDVRARRAVSLSLKLSALSEDADCAEVIVQLARLMKDIQHGDPCDSILDSLSASHRKLLADNIEKENLATVQASQGGMFSLGNISREPVVVNNANGSVAVLSGTF